MKKFTALLVFLSLGCSHNDDDTTNCTDVYTPGLIVTVKDASTGAVLSDNVTVTATDGDYIEELHVPEPETDFYGAYERKGTYVITVTSDGYIPYTSDPVTVDADECHVLTQDVSVMLQPEP